MEVTLTFNKGFKGRRQQMFAEMQTFIDTACIEKMQPFVPVARSFYKNAGKLKASVRNEQPGLIEYTAPRARHDYYAAVNHAHGGNKQAQRMWFEYMKSRGSRDIAEGMAAIARRYSK
uniref:Minor capsid protein n=1 Tax=Siphoviridae sp. ctXBp18 TaxID=2825541 RepID=A0A8S5PK34_9CAUD|nr:MAG TPA: Minor capsid protein [Siphoviridae sp. ctXBp18]